jgi:hypothetical protein
MKIWIVPLALMLAACGGEAPPVRSAGRVPVPTAIPAPASIAAIRGQNAARLVTQFGKPQLDVSEGRARKLQFAGPVCVLDTYLYPPANGRGEPTVTYLETRQRDGSPIDPASCVAALNARR